MKLELQKAKVKNIAWGDKTALLADGTLQINKEEFIAAAADSEHFKTLDADLARPGESVRVCPVKDVIEPRYKTEGSGQVFPGMLSDVETVGSGKTFVLEGAAVLTCGRIVGFQEGIIDMQGPGADYTPFSKTMNAVLVFEPVEGLEAHEYEKACRMAGFRAAFYIAEAAWKAGAHVDTTETYELPCFAEAMKAYPELPKVAYIYMLQTQGLLHDTYVYGVDAKKIIPSLIHPNETMDGAIVSGNCVSACDKNSTYVHLNNPVIRNLYDRHGKDINFVGVIITNENVTLADKKRSSSYAVKLATMLGVDGVIVSEEGNQDRPRHRRICGTRRRQPVPRRLRSGSDRGRNGGQREHDDRPAADGEVHRIHRLRQHHRRRLRRIAPPRRLDRGRTSGDHRRHLRTRIQPDQRQDLVGGLRQ